MLNPLVILLIGVVVVVGMIIVLRVNAFIALITAAMVVSLLSAGELGEKISRVADAFGDAAAKIGIVIALAAVIGKCLMDSGAADRIVRSFLKVLGEKRSSWALMGSGFVLSIPVFFDTVFYLLVPLARSLWKRTHKNYVLYVTAIGCGAAITHTLVPPTPGPLIMAEFLNIKLGLMIMMGVLVGFPTAVVGLWVCRVMNRVFDIPMRPYSGETEPDPLADEELPPLWLSLLPILLPVILICTNTVTETALSEATIAAMKSGRVFDWLGWTAIFGDPNAEAVKDRLGYLPEEKGLYKKMKAGEILAYFGRLKGMPARDARKKAADLLERYGLGDWIDRRCETLSKGMSQKVQILATLIHDPDMVILDEPFSGLDPVNRDLMRDVIVGMKREGRTVIFSTHVMEQAEQICDSILMINKGKKVLDGSLAEVKAAGEKGIMLDYDGDGTVLRSLPGVRRVNDSGKRAEIIMEPGADPQEILAALVGRVAVRRFDLRDQSLHEIFIRMVGGKSDE